MKRIILIILLLETVRSFGQFEMPKGSKQKGLAGSIASSSDKFTSWYYPYPSQLRQNNTLVSCVTNINWFIANNMSLGVSCTASFSRSVLRNESSGKRISESSSLLFNIGPSFRYYLKSGFFAEASPGITVYSSGNRYLYANARVGIGYARLITPDLAIEPMLSYTRTSSFDQPNPTNLFLFGIGLSYYKKPS
jgi:hypothetical protein